MARAKRLATGWVGSCSGTSGAVDPGKTTCAAAIADRRDALVGFGTMSSGARPQDHSGWDIICTGRVTYELPESRGENGVPANDLIPLAAAGAACAAWMSVDIAAVTPTEWKGNTPKPIHHGRLWKVLTPAERKLLGGASTYAAIESAKRRGASERWKRDGKLYYRAADMPTLAGGLRLTHDNLDAVALLMFALGRLSR